MPIEVAGDDRLLDALAARVHRLVGLPAPQLTHELRSVAQDAMLAVGADGSWIGTDAVREALTMVVDVADAARFEAGPSADDLDAGLRPWLDAVRTSLRSRPLLDDLLEELRHSVRPPGPSAVDRHLDLLRDQAGAGASE